MLRTAPSVPAGARVPGRPSRGRLVPAGARVPGRPSRGRLVPAAAIAAACATFALAACGPVQMGAAAVVGSDRITSGALTAQVSNLETAYRHSAGKVQLQFPLSQAPQQVLSWLVRFRIRERMAVRNHVTVTRGESQRALASIVAQTRQSGGGNVPLAALAAANGLPPDLLGELGRYQAIQNSIVSQIDGGTMPTSNSALQTLGQKFDHEQCIAAKSLDIKINPQFGQLDYGQYTVVLAASTLSAPQSPQPSPTSSPRLTPPC